MPLPFKLSSISTRLLSGISCVDITVQPQEIISEISRATTENWHTFWDRLDDMLKVLIKQHFLTSASISMVTYASPFEPLLAFFALLWVFVVIGFRGWKIGIRAIFPAFNWHLGLGYHDKQGTTYILDCLGLRGFIAWQRKSEMDGMCVSRLCSVDILLTVGFCIFVIIHETGSKSKGKYQYWEKLLSSYFFWVEVLRAEVLRPCTTGNSKAIGGSPSSLSTGVFFPFSLLQRSEALKDLLHWLEPEGCLMLR